MSIEKDDPLDDPKLEEAVRAGGEDAVRWVMQFLLVQMFDRGRRRVVLHGDASATRISAPSDDGKADEWKSVPVGLDDFRKLFARWTREAPNGDEFSFNVNGDSWAGRVSSCGSDALQLELIPEGATP